MTTDPTPLQERIARALAVPLGCEFTMIGVPKGDAIWCITHDIGIDNGEWCREVDHAAAAVLPIVEAEVRAAKAEALREAADGLLENIDWSDGRSSYGDNDGYEASARELRARATEYETGDQA